MTHDLFVYGTLRYPVILEILLGRVPDLAPAFARGWRVKALPGVVYPGMVADPDGVAAGVLIGGLAEAEHRLLDAYEDDDYDPAIISVDVRRAGEARQAGTVRRADEVRRAGAGRRVRAYVWTGATEPHDWDPERFAEHDLARFAEGCRAWRASLDRAEF